MIDGEFRIKVTCDSPSMLGNIGETLWASLHAIEDPTNKGHVRDGRPFTFTIAEIHDSPAS